MEPRCKCNLQVPIRTIIKDKVWNCNRLLRDGPQLNFCHIIKRSYDQGKKRKATGLWNGKELTFQAIRESRIGVR